MSYALEAWLDGKCDVADRYEIYIYIDIPRINKYIYVYIKVVDRLVDVLLGGASLARAPRAWVGQVLRRSRGSEQEKKPHQARTKH